MRMEDLPTRKNDPNEIWFLTSIYINEDTMLRHPKTGEIKVERHERTFGYYRGWDKALAAVKENRCNMHECLYQYLVMERIGEGIHALAEDVQWFVWSGKRWMPLKSQPNWARGLTNWALG